MKRKFLLLTLFTLSILFVAAKDKQKNQNQIATNDDYNYIAVNNCMMWVSNNGGGSHDPRNDYNGFFWPGGEKATKSLVYYDGLIWGGEIDDEIRAGGNVYRAGLQAGKILPDGTDDDPGKEKYRVYKIRKNWESLPPGTKRDAYEKDYNEWPVEDGAPWIDVNGDGVFTRGIDKPEFIGDETLWYVSNDLDPARTTFNLGSLPMGLEIQTTVYSFFNPKILLHNAIIKKYKVINKGSYTIKNMYFGYFADPDLGNPEDDFIGCDTLLNLGYCYNENESDAIYETPPAIGYTLLQGPIVKAGANDIARFGERFIKGYKNLEMTSFVFNYYESEQGVAEASLQHYYSLQGKVWNGEYQINPVTGKETKYFFSGNPVSNNGWLDQHCTDYFHDRITCNRRFIMGSGPFDFAPGDTQKVTIGILVSQGDNNIQSVDELKKDAEKLQLFYYNYKPEKPEPIIELPENYYLSQNYPNPFSKSLSGNSATTINYELPVEQFVTLKVYNILGETVATLVNQRQSAGKYQVTFNAANLPSGIYIYRIEAGIFEKTKKMILLR